MPYCSFSYLFSEDIILIMKDKNWSSFCTIYRCAQKQQQVSQYNINKMFLFSVRWMMECNVNMPGHMTLLREKQATLEMQLMPVSTVSIDELPIGVCGNDFVGLVQFSYGTQEHSWFLLWFLKTNLQYSFYSVKYDFTKMCPNVTFTFTWNIFTPLIIQQQQRYRLIIDH